MRNPSSAVRRPAVGVLVLVSLGAAAACSVDESSTRPREMLFRATVERRIDGDCDAIATAAVGLGRTGLLVEDYEGSENLLTASGSDDGSLVPVVDEVAGPAPKAILALPKRPVALAATLFESFIRGFFESRSQAAPGQAFEEARECCLFPVPASRFVPDPLDPDERNLFGYLGLRNGAAGPVYCATPPPDVVSCREYLCALFDDERTQLPPNLCTGLPRDPPAPPAPLCEVRGELNLEFSRVYNVR